ncbi:MAG: hypothetical protein LBC99_04325 [Spirochaetota bacterium]|jgi:hypothetical protein|nr:hypothetical protein [Spirochaetota bacterium]
MLTVLINNEPIDAAFEHEKTLNEIVASLERWLGERDLVCTAIEVDGQVIDPSNRVYLAERPVSSVQKISLTASPLALIEGENCVEIMHYLSRFGEALAGGSDEIYSPEAREGLRWVMGSIRLLAGLHHIDLESCPSRENSLAKIMFALEQGVLDLETSPSDVRHKERYREVLLQTLKPLTAQACEILLQVNKNIESNEDFAAQIEKLKKSFAQQAQAIETVASDLQTGKEVRALAQIQKTVVLLEEFVSLMEKMHRRSLINLDNIRSEDGEISEWLEKITHIGQEIIQAFDGKDNILLGDLFEYEIREEFKKASGFLDVVLREYMAGTIE